MVTAATRAGVEPIAHAPKRDEALGAELAPQISHVHVDDIGPRVVVIAPDMAQQLFAGQHLPWMTQEGLSEGELTRGQVHGAPVDMRPAGAQIQL